MNKILQHKDYLALNKKYENILIKSEDDIPNGFVKLNKGDTLQCWTDFLICSDGSLEAVNALAGSIFGVSYLGGYKMVIRKPFKLKQKESEKGKENWQ